MKRNAVLLFLAGAMIWVSMYVYVPILPAYASSLGATSSAIGLISGVYGLLPIFLCIILGYMAGRLGKDKLLLIAGMAIVIVSGLVFLFTNSVTGLFIARAISAAGSAWWVIFCSTYAKFVPEDKEVAGQGQISFSANLGKMIGCTCCIFASQGLAYKRNFVVAIVAGAVGVLLLALMGGHKGRTGVHAERLSLKEEFMLMKNKEIIFFGILGMLSQMISFAVPTTFTPVAAQKIGANSTDLSLIQLVYVTVVGFTSLIAGTKFYEKVGGIRMLAYSFVLGAVSCIPQFYTQMWMIYVMQILSGYCYGVSLAALSGFVVSGVPKLDRSGALGVFQSIYSIGVFIGPTLTGVLMEKFSFDFAYWFFAGISVLAAVLCPLLVPKKYEHMT